MSLEEIEKLRQKVDKDLNSRLFLPLAEEYRKAGMLDEAISVLLSGLDRQPGYTSARVALGRLYIEKKMIDEARAEFEKVVSTIPDNLFAHRKLAEIYRELGETEKAVSEYRSVVRLNPLDEDARLCLESLEPKQTIETFVSPEVSEIEAGEEIKETEAPVKSDVMEETVTEPPQQVEEVLEKDVGALSDKGHEVEQEGMESSEVAEEIFDISGDLAEESIFEDVYEEEAEVPEKPSGDAGYAIHGKEPEIDVSNADAFIAGGNYYRAMEAYREMLTKNPDNKSLLQRATELKQLMKLSGKDDETIIRLEAFLNGIRKGFPKKS